MAIPFKLNLKALSADGHPFQADNLSMTSLALEVMSPNNEAVSCKINPCEDGDDLLIAKYLPTKPGKYQVTARYCGQHFSGSPADVMASACAFSPSRCHGHIQLSNNNMTVKRTGYYVCSFEVYSKGTVDIGMHFDSAPPGHDILIGLCSSPWSLPMFYDGNSIIGWRSRNKEHGGT